MYYEISFHKILYIPCFKKNLRLKYVLSYSMSYFKSHIVFGFDQHSATVLYAQRLVNLDTDLSPGHKIPNSGMHKHFFSNEQCMRL